MWESLNKWLEALPWYCEYIAVAGSIIIAGWMVYDVIKIIQKKKVEKLEFIKSIELKKNTIDGFICPETIKEKGIQTYDGYNIEIVPNVFDDYIHIQWEKMKFISHGSVVMYRRTDGFEQDCFNKTANGIIVTDSMENVGVFKDMGSDLERGKTYYYTVNYEVNKTGQVFSIARFTATLLEATPEVQQEKSKTEVLKELKTQELEQQMVIQDHQREKMFSELTACIKNKMSAEEFIENTKYGLIDEIKTKKGRVTKKDREGVEKLIEDLEDRASFLLDGM